MEISTWLSRRQAWLLGVAIGWSLLCAGGVARAGKFIPDQRITICVAGNCTGTDSATVDGVRFTVRVVELPPTGNCMPGAPKRYFAFYLTPSNQSSVGKQVAVNAASLLTDGMTTWANAPGGYFDRLPPGADTTWNFATDCIDGSPQAGTFVVNVSDAPHSTGKPGARPTPPRSPPPTPRYYVSQAGDTIVNGKQTTAGAPPSGSHSPPKPPNARPAAPQASVAQCEPGYHVCPVGVAKDCCADQPGSHRSPAKSVQGSTPSRDGEGARSVAGGLRHLEFVDHQKAEVAARAAEREAAQREAAEQVAARQQQAVADRRASALESAAANHDERAQRALESGTGNAIGETLLAQLDRIDASLVQRQNYTASGQLESSIQTVETGQAVSGAIQSVGTSLVNAWAASRAEERAEQERQQAEFDALSDRAQALTPAWEAYEAVVTRLRANAEYRYFRSSPEYASCGGGSVERLNFPGVARDLALYPSTQGEAARQRRAMGSVASGRAVVRCVATAFESWRQRIEGLCASIRPSRPSDLAAVRAKHPDLPQRCLDAAARSYRSTLGATLKTGGAPARTTPAPPGGGRESTHGLKLKPL